MSSPNTLLRSDFTDLDPSTLLKHNIRLLGVDVENLLTDYGDTVVRPEAAVHMDTIRTAGINTVLITNNRNSLAPTGVSVLDRGFVDEVASQLNNPAVYFPQTTMFREVKGKTHPDLFIAAATDAGLQDEPERCAHVDDQYKSMKGLRAANWGLFVWTRPYGEHQHPGVRLARIPEAAIRAGLQMRGILTHD